MKQILNSAAYLDRTDVGVLSHVFVLIQAILGEFPFAQIDRQLDEQEHDGFQGGDGTVPGPLRSDMFVQERQRGLSLADRDKLLSSL